MRKPREIHGATGTKLYSVWGGMWKRCTAPNYRRYADYGGRGITVCERWRDFSVFRQDMGEPAPGLTLERIDNNGPYSKENCTWATLDEQANNKRSNLAITFNGKTQSLSRWARELGFSYQTVKWRHQTGATPETGLFSAKREYRAPKEAQIKRTLAAIRNGRVKQE